MGVLVLLISVQDGPADFISKSKSLHYRLHAVHNDLNAVLRLKDLFYLTVSFVYIWLLNTCRKTTCGLRKQQ